MGWLWSVCLWRAITEKLPRTLSPEWQSLTNEYRKHNNA